MYVMKFTIYLKLSNIQLKEISKAMYHVTVLTVNHRQRWMCFSSKQKSASVGKYWARKTWS
jgi:hypothetical protein